MKYEGDEAQANHHGSLNRVMAGTKPVAGTKTNTDTPLPHAGGTTTHHGSNVYNIQRN